VPVIVLVAVAVLAVALLTGHSPKFGPLASSQQPNPATNQGTTAQSALTIGMYPGQQQRGVFQTINRVVASGNTIVTMGSQTSGAWSASSSSSPSTAAPPGAWPR
jgi:hypothetical protein